MTAFLFIITILYLIWKAPNSHPVSPVALLTIEELELLQGEKTVQVRAHTRRPPRKSGILSA